MGLNSKATSFADSIGEMFDVSPSKSHTSLDDEEFLSRIRGSYLVWVQNVLWVILRGYDVLRDEMRYMAIRSVKRGDSFYAGRVMRRFNRFTHELESESEFFSHKTRGLARTSLLFFSLTVDAKKYSIEEAWLSIGVLFNRFLSSLKRKYGKISIVRVWESTYRGYPDIHCIILFQDKEFEGFRDRKNKFRVKWERERLSEGWSMGFADIQMVYSIGGGMRYLGKYLSKSVCYENASDKTLNCLALCWYFHKRAFSLGGDFVAVYNDLIGTSSNSNVKWVQVRFEGDPVPVSGVLKWVVLAFLPGDRVGWGRFHMLSRSDMVEVADDFMYARIK
ncbi:hypothetical protein E3J74_09190 [Candidatus Bathyarchaeota archaeon]|nr:MAG: hypothetical protein E3J74_09190 [Candidatus Bathyarchaeota archaeon]